MIRRVLLVLGVLGVLLLLVSLLPDGPSGTEPDDPLDAPVYVASGDAASSTWFCAAADAGTPNPSSHVVSLSNPGGEPLAARVTSYGAPGTEPAVVEVEVPAHSVVPIGADRFGGAQPGSVAVSANGLLLASHRLIGDGASDEAVCSSRGSGTWYFPAAYSFNSGSLPAGSARLWVFNPFTSDASIDVTIVTEAGVRRPGELTGVVIGAGAARAIELGEVAQRREQFAAVVETRSGRVVAELAQATDGTSTAPRGLRIQTGIPRAAERWVFPDSEGVEGVAEQLIVHNPAPDPITVQVAVRPDGADPAAYPDPFVLDVPGRRYAILDLSSETRLPPVGARTITIDTDAATGVVAQRVVSVRGSGGWPLSSGTANSSGITVEATRWWIPRVDQAAPGRSILRLVNTSEDSIAVVEIAASAGGSVTPAEDVTRVEVPAGRAVTVDAGAFAAPDVPATLTLTASRPVVVERRAFSSADTDLWVVPGVADRSGSRPAGSLPSVLEPG